MNNSCSALASFFEQFQRACTSLGAEKHIPIHSKQNKSSKVAEWIWDPRGSD